MITKTTPTLCATFILLLTLMRSRNFFIRSADVFDRSLRSKRATRREFSRRFYFRAFDSFPSSVFFGFANLGAQPLLLPFINLKFYSDSSRISHISVFGLLNPLRQFLNLSLVSRISQWSDEIRGRASSTFARILRSSVNPI